MSNTWLPPWCAASTYLAKEYANWWKVENSLKIILFELNFIDVTFWWADNEFLARNQFEDMRVHEREDANWSSFLGILWGLQIWRVRTYFSLLEGGFGKWRTDDAHRLWCRFDGFFLSMLATSVYPLDNSIVFAYCLRSLCPVNYRECSQRLMHCVLGAYILACMWLLGT